jgi:phosphoglycolate phosphatase
MTHDALRLAVRAVALDLDGTLLDTAADIAAAVDATLAALDLAPVGPAAVRGFIGEGVAHLLRSALARSAGVEPAPEAVDRAREVFDREYLAGLARQTALYPGAGEGLIALRAAGFPIACVTNKPERFTLPLLRQLRLESYFALVVSGDTLPVKKPDPGQLLHVSDRLGAPPERLLLIGDSTHDLRAARAAGCPVFCVTYGYTPDPAALARQADAALTSLLDVIGRIALMP